MILKPLPVELPPGLYNNGNQQDATGRWFDGNLIRWVDGKMRAVGGWSRRLDIDESAIPPLISDPATAAPRGIFGWRDNSGGRLLAVGTTTELFVVDSTGSVTDITPDEFVPGNKNSGFLEGFGVGSYGAQSYGTPREGIGLLPDPVGSWRFDAWGENLLAAGPLGNTTELFEWVPGSSDPAGLVANAPSDFADFIVTDLRQVLVVGAGSDGRGIAWSDREDNTQWTPAVNNQAGSITVKGKGRLRAVVQVGSEYLVIGDQEVHRGVYTGPLYGYGFTFVDSGCGCISAASVVSVGGAALWPGKNQFYVYTGGVVQPVPCPVLDYFNKHRNQVEDSKCFGFTNKAFNEIWWLYESADSSGDVDRYISYDYVQRIWSYGKINRCVGIDAEITSNPLMLDREGRIYVHEQEDVVLANLSNQPYALSGPISVNYGGQIAAIDYVMPVTQEEGGVTFKLHCRDYPTHSGRVAGPYALKFPVTPVKARGREIDLEITGNASVASWKVSAFKLNITPDGDR